MQGSQFAYQDVEVACFTASRHMQSALRGALEAAGFTHIHDTSNVNDLINLLNRQRIDLLLIDIEPEPGTVCEILRQIRNGLLGADPFVAIIALISGPQDDIMKQAVEAGSDAVIAAPISASVLLEHTANLVENRKGFVATASYIGPDRRLPGREHPADLPTIVAPNALRHRAIGDDAAAATTQSINATRQLLRLHLVFRTAAMISDEVLKHSWQLLDRNDAAERATEFDVLFERIRAAARLIDEAALADLMPLADAMRALVDSMLGSGEPKARLLTVIRLQCQAIMASIKKENGAPDLISNALARSAEVFVE